jgi:hypothetical protein
MHTEEPSNRVEEITREKESHIIHFPPEGSWTAMVNDKHMRALRLHQWFVRGVFKVQSQVFKLFDEVFKLLGSLREGKVGL